MTYCDWSDCQARSEFSNRYFFCVAIGSVKVKTSDN
jgi:hypothetical protein